LYAHTYSEASLRPKKTLRLTAASLGCRAESAAGGRRFGG
jgi:hypothetical protein